MKKKTSSQVRTFVRATRGANMVEYIILVGLVALAAIGGYTKFGASATKAVKDQAGTVDKVPTAAGN